MKQTILIFAAFLPFFLFAQSDSNSKTKKSTGKATLIEFIHQHFVVPESESDIKGRIVVSFVVNEDGSVSDIVVKQGLSTLLDEEAVRVIKLVNYGPGQKANYTVPIVIG
ncbi:MAG TPA: TonB family protein [Chitinophagales bacterium]